MVSVGGVGRLDCGFKNPSTPGCFSGRLLVNKWPDLQVVIGERMCHDLMRDFRLSEAFC